MKLKSDEIVVNYPPRPEPEEYQHVNANSVFLTSGEEQGIR